MTTIYERRHSRWYELLLLSGSFHLLVSLLFVVLLPAILWWGYDFWQHINVVRSNTLWVSGVSVAIIFFLLKRLASFSGEIQAHIVPVVTVVFLLAFAVLFFSRSGYSRPVLLFSFGLCLLWCHVGYFVGRRYRKLKIAALPMAQCATITSTRNIEVRHLSSPNLGGVRFDGIVADLGGASMTPEWERFLAECILAHIPVFDVKRMQERMTGRVQIAHLSENAVGALLPSPLYTPFKRLIDVAGVLLLLPIALPLMLLTAIAIRLDSKGPALFIQKRVGRGNRDFKIFKFRSMRIDAESAGAQMAGESDDRITRVGRFIRKTRLDELPQFINVLKGDMSLIGPRPEQRAFVTHFDKDIPFYIYRHVVRPGISGWAQVTQGYAGDADETRIKIQHDFYYIKHFSLWLDILIVLKTIRVIITGSGAR